MYLNFYGLKEEAFNTTPDPKFLFLTPGHREALAQLVYGVKAQKGFLLVIGEVGTGKTTLLRALIQRLDATTAVTFVSHSTLSFDGLLEYVLEDFGIAKGPQTQAQRLVALQHFLVDRRRAGQNTVLIFDEAQNLAAETLEQVRLLSNFETSSDKLIQIILSGQPELGTKLAQPELRQLRQRVALRCRIPELTVAEVRHYIRTRLRIAGATDLGIFSDRAIARIAQYTQGIPRLINILCDHCLVIGYADQQRRVDSSVVEQGIKYVEHGPGSRRTVRRHEGHGRIVDGGALRLLAAGAGGMVFTLILLTLAADPLHAVADGLSSIGETVWHAISGLIGR